MSRRFPQYFSPLCLALLILSLVGIIEWQYPHYFLKADNLDQNLPYYVHNLRAVLEGEFPLFNFHQFLGTPVFACIQSAALYLPNYIALVLSKWLCGNYYWAIDLLAAFHLVAAAIGFSLLTRQWGLGTISGFFAGISWALCGFVMRVGDGWIQVIEYAAFFPWILLYGQRLAWTPALRPFIILTLLRTAALWVGNPPFFMYVVTFDLLFAFVCHGINRDKPPPVSNESDKVGVLSFIIRHCSSYGIAAILSAPLLLPAFSQIASSADRSSALTWEMYSRGGYTFSLWVRGLLLPFNSEYYQLFGQELFFPHIGWLPVIFALAAIFCRPPYRRLAIVLLLLAGVSLLWANNTFVTRLVYHIPFYNRQRFPFKLLFFSSFFSIALAAVGLERLLDAVRKCQRPEVIVTVILVVQVTNLLAFHLSTPYDTRKVKLIPYTEQLQEKLSTGRIVTIVSQETDDQDKQPYLLGYNFATLFGLYHFAGYETLVSRANLEAALERNGSADFFVDNNMFAPDPSELEYFRHWGVKWYVLEKQITIPESSILRTVYRGNDRLIAYDPAARPFVYWEDDPETEAVQHRFSTNSIRIETRRERPGRLVVNTLYNRLFTAVIDDRQVDVSATSGNQIGLLIPPGQHVVKVTYHDPYFAAGWYVTGAFLCTAAVWIFMRRRKCAPIGD
ncbi:hypothetical protein KI809_19765 [Geobacter pelophilus]|uniref:Membrane protein YfhO n=1 Tax=Geoanaerobacter pelophilus TaxID=60036 RepID=A0AAW4L6M6_9BACT|nr:hypothetical protein [Geoanaerobacter pelophilus]MBT0666553.1 hypothetical protein [Geoanaerobacter pelophilus]